MHPVRTASLLVLLLVASAGAYAVAGPSAGGSQSSRSVSTTLRDADGKAVGTAQVLQRGDVAKVTVRARSLPPGFHGFHVHGVGTCTAPTFESAMGHLKRGGQDHGEHLGDLPSLLVKRDGTARLVTETNSFSVAALRRGDGTAIMVHAKPDNFANLPGRYDPAPDQETRDTGDSGDRIACGEIR